MACAIPTDTSPPTLRSPVATRSKAITTKVDVPFGVEMERIWIFAMDAATRMERFLGNSRVEGDIRNRVAITMISTTSTPDPMKVLRLPLRS